MQQLDEITVKYLAGKYAWWKTLDEVAQQPERVVAQVMNIGDYGDDR